MTTVSVIILLLCFAVLWVLFWKQWQADDSSVVPEKDMRITPLLRGINYLLSDEPDLALQEMVQVAKLRSEAVDVYMALGEMFRAKGEFGRAVRIHQNILARPDISQALYLQAHLALAKDFQAGGLLDRALRHFQKVMDVQSGHVNALLASLRIRELSSEWHEAEDLLSRIERIQGQVNGMHRAYLWAAMAQEALDAGRIDEADEYANKSLSLAKECAHAYLILLAIAVQRENQAQIESCMDAMQQQTPDYIALVLRSLGVKKHKDILLQAWNQTKNHELALAWLERLGNEDSDSSVTALKKELSFEAMDLRESLRLSALGLNTDTALVAQAKSWRKLMKQYACKQCGVQTVDMRWQCPQCHTWGSLSTIVESEL